MTTDAVGTDPACDEKLSTSTVAPDEEKHVSPALTALGGRCADYPQELSCQDMGHTLSRIHVPKNTVLEPVCVVSGEKVLTQTDFDLGGAVPLQWNRTYRSSNNTDLGQGAGWITLWHSRVLVGEKQVTYVDALGRFIAFKRPGVGGSSCNSTEALSLYCDSEEHYRIQDQRGLQYVFSGQGQRKRLLQISNPAGAWCYCHYDAANRLEHIEDNAGRNLQLQYGGGEESRVVAVLLLHQAPETHVTVLVEYVYDAAGDLVAVVDGNGNAQRYTYRNHVLTRHSTRDGFTHRFQWDRYDKLGRCVRSWGDRGFDNYRITYEPEKMITRCEDSRGCNEYHYNALGLITRHVDAEGGVTQYQYSSHARLIVQTDPLGHSTRYVYDDQDRLVNVIQADKSSIRLSYGAFDKPIMIRDALGQSWSFDFDSQGKRVSCTDPSGALTRFCYDARGNVTRVEDPAGRSLCYEWNQRNELVAQTDASGVRTDFEYNERGLLTRARSLGRTTQYYYDGNGALTQVYFADGSSIQLQYSPGGHLTHYIDPVGRTTRYRYDGMNYPAERIDAAGRCIYFEYDGRRRVTAVTNENNERYEFSYDRNGRLVKEVGFDGREQQYGYDAAGHLIQHKDGSSRITVYSRDEMGRVIQKQSTDDLCLYDYDALGRLIQACNNSSEIKFKYNEQGRLVEEHQNGLRVCYEYNSLGQKTWVRLPGGERLRYEYDSSGLFTRLSYSREIETAKDETAIDETIEAGKASLSDICTIRRDRWGRETGRDYGFYRSLDEYDSMGRLVHRRVGKSRMGDAVMDCTYRYNKTGTLKVLEDALWGQVQFHYDPTDRLQSVETDALEYMVSDPAGNMAATSDVPVDSNSQHTSGNRLAEWQGHKLEYDYPGNLIAMSGLHDNVRYNYDGSNRLVKVEKNGQEFQYTYDPLGRRIRKTDTFGETLFLWSGNIVISEFRNKMQTLYLHDPEGLELLAKVCEGEIGFCHTDFQGTPQVFTDLDGNVIWQAHTTYFGEVTALSVELQKNTIRFRGWYYDAESGLLFDGERYYHGAMGRYVSQARSGLGEVYNSYACQNPCIPNLLSRGFVPSGDDLAITFIRNVLNVALEPDRVILNRIHPRAAEFGSFRPDACLATVSETLCYSNLLFSKDCFSRWNSGLS